MNYLRCIYNMIDDDDDDDEENRHGQRTALSTLTS